MQVFQTPVDLRARNFIPNAALDFWQRATTRTVTTSGGYTADRITSGINGSGISYTVSRVVAAPPNPIRPTYYSLSVANNTAKASFSAAEYLSPVVFNLEGRFCTDLSNKDITIGFYIYSTSDTTISLRLRSEDSTRSYVTAISLKTGWGYYTKNIKLDLSISVGNSIGFQVSLAAIGGSNYIASDLDTWLNGNFLTHASIPNWAATTGEKFYIYQPQLRYGTLSPQEMQSTFSLMNGNYDAEWYHMLRYFTKSYNYIDLPGTVTNGGSIAAVSSGTATGTAQVLIRFYTLMRAVPSITSYNPATGATGSFNRVGTAISAGVTALDTSGCALYNTATTIDQSNHTIHYTADAEF